MKKSTSLRQLVRALTAPVIAKQAANDVVSLGAEARRAVREAWPTMGMVPWDWYLYYVPGQVRLAVAQEIPPPLEGRPYAATGYRVSCSWTEDEMTERIHQFARTLPLYGGAR